MELVRFISPWIGERFSEYIARLIFIHKRMAKNPINEGKPDFAIGDEFNGFTVKVTKDSTVESIYTEYKAYLNENTFTP